MSWLLFFQIMFLIFFTSTCMLAIIRAARKSDEVREPPSSFDL